MALTTLLALSVAACVTRGDIEEIKENQKTIIDKLEKVARAPARPTPPQRPRGPDRASTYSFPVGESFARGSNDALITLIEVTDFQCPYCKRVGPTLDALEKKYGKDLRRVLKHNPLGFHPNAMPAAMAAECAGEQGKFWEMKKALFDNSKALAKEQLSTYATQVGLDVGRWKKCFDGDKYKDKILADQRTATQLGARGTPAFFINGRFISGAQPQQKFEALIDEELKKAKDSGIARADYYRKAVVEKGKKKL
jgi:protein-disulfide isomerase